MKRTLKDGDLQAVAIAAKACGNINGGDPADVGITLQLVGIALNVLLRHLTNETARETDGDYRR